ncbi:soma ferritin-like [Anoplophora glabripennis]|uniref:soma ferritin-like n=1 Tax=Anoplophora glabripennis TaxID=217634 RepID=UPI000873D66F|nr:soma ferritin-like [Anoplophora glabripennis]
MTKTIKFLFLNNLVKLLVPHSQQLKSFKPSMFPKRNLLPTPHRNVHVKDSSVYENLINQNMSQTKFCTKPKKDDNKDPPGRHKYHKDTEKSVNDQIAAELNAAFSYLSMACYFGRTEVSLPGCQGFFMDMYEEELDHAMVFINYQLLRGAHVTLSDIDVPECQDWMCINNAFSAALEMEKLVKEKLDSVFEIAEKHKDLEVMDIVSTQFMKEQVIF